MSKWLDSMCKAPVFPIFKVNFIKRLFNNCIMRTPVSIYVGINCRTYIFSVLAKLAAISLEVISFVPL